MAGPRPMNNTVQVVTVGDRIGQDVINTFYFHYNPAGVPPTVADMNDLLDLFTTVVMPYLASCAGSDVRWTALKATDLGVLPQITTQKLLTTPIIGSRPGATMPGNVSVGLKRLTSLHGRSYRGRIELPPPGIADVVRDILTGPLQTAVTTLAIQLLERFTATSGATFIPAVGSFKRVASEVITSWLFDTVSDSQSTRLTNHGT